ncbi:MAG: hypothetical protein RL341_296, partial [Pseudomonadota bacterium]
DVSNQPINQKERRVKSNSIIRTAMLQRLLQGGACLRAFSRSRHARAWVRVHTSAPMQALTPKMGFGLAGAAFGLAASAAGNAGNGGNGFDARSFDPEVVTRPS